MAKITEQEMTAMDGMTPLQCWRLAFWDIFRPGKRNLWKHGVKIGKSGSWAFKDALKYKTITTKTLNNFFKKYGV